MTMARVWALILLRMSSRSGSQPWTRHTGNAWACRREADGRRPQRVVRRRHQHFVAGIEQRVHGHYDQLGNAVADVDVVQGHALDALLLGVVHDRLAGGEDPLESV